MYKNNIAAHRMYCTSYMPLWCTISLAIASCTWSSHLHAFTCRLRKCVRGGRVTCVVLLGLIQHSVNLLWIFTIKSIEYNHEDPIPLPLKREHFVVAIRTWRLPRKYDYLCNWCLFFYSHTRTFICRHAQKTTDHVHNLKTWHYHSLIT